MAKDGETPAGGGSGERAEEMTDSLFLSGANAGYLDAQYALYAKNPAAVSPGLRTYFARLGDSAET
ncbi:MAG TPA: hypothetical protein VNH64_07085, partial [Parvularculaceae bacterium]|nr:hypothetical protein [Parvularculaceae bacterium]